MSLKASKLVWKYSNQTGSGKLLMLAIADHTNKDGIAWPSIKRLSTFIGVKSRRVKRLIKDAEKVGELKVARNVGRGNTNEYVITLKGVLDDTINDKEKVSSAAEKVSSVTLKEPEKVSCGTPRTIIKENHYEPLFELAEYFTSQTALFSPHDSTIEWDLKWAQPLQAIIAHCASDTDRAKRLIDDAIAKNRELRYPVMSPKSIYKVALNLTSEDRKQVSVAIGSR
jgi:hypothetical protein